jgi:hypothetical protein
MDFCHNDYSRTAIIERTEKDVNLKPGFRDQGALEKESLWYILAP